MTSNLILVPGLLCSHDLWVDQIGEFEDDFDMVIFDHTSHDNLPDMVRDFLADAPERFHLAGLSMGGYVAFELLRQAADRVESLILLDTNARADRPEQVAGRQQLIERADKEDIREIAKDLLPVLVHPDRLRDEEICDRIVDMAVEVGAEAFQRQQKALIRRPDSRDFLTTIKCPTLIICGAQDALTPLKVHQEMADLIPGAELHVVDDCGHLSSMERPEEINRLMRNFLVPE